MIIQEIRNEKTIKRSREKETKILKEEKKANMSYCRFRNTVGDLRDCLEHISDEPSYEETRAREELLRLIVDFVVEAELYDEDGQELGRNKLMARIKDCYGIEIKSRES